MIEAAEVCHTFESILGLSPSLAVGRRSLVWPLGSMPLFQLQPVSQLNVYTCKPAHLEAGHSFFSAMRP